MTTFNSALKEELNHSQSNNYGIENFDEHRFGELVIHNVPANSFFHFSKQVVKKIIGYNKIQRKRFFKECVDKCLNEIKKYEEGLEYLYENLNSGGKELLVKIISYRLLGYSKVKLPFNNPQYWNSLELVKTLKDGNDKYDPHFMHFILEKYDLCPIGFNVKLFFSEVGIAIGFIAEQYAYKESDKILIQANKGDVVLDIGGCWGDTALYFGEKIGEAGKVYSFEFIPDNIKLHNINTSLNPSLKNRIELVPFPAANISGQPVYFKDSGPGSQIEQHPFEGQTGSTCTISIDDYIIENNVPKVDFIKMDIEGAELLALEGAIETIKKCKPVLAIAIYHSMEDFLNIPKWILNLGLGYELFLGHYTIHGEETICFAKPKRR